MNGAEAMLTTAFDAGIDVCFANELVERNLSGC